jgi:hypothetical protein
MSCSDAIEQLVLGCQILLLVWIAGRDTLTVEI